MTTTDKWRWKSSFFLFHGSACCNRSVTNPTVPDAESTRDYAVWPCTQHALSKVTPKAQAVLEIQASGSEGGSYKEKSLHQCITTPTLMQRIENPPLAAHLSSTPPLPNLAPPVPTHIHFHKTKILKRIEEYWILFEVVKIRMDLVFIKLREENIKETPSIPLERRNAL
ncbi:hypothetical protein AX16_010786 [Volvariella volvacea WC 439]|nr:hypothetical protein AX16_010786 [Volvariella volvacea WC 439]